ncbi:MAG: universal stress protein [Sulfitobacter sp.]|nr:universal stress protein [Sulfitobacter sp.]
MYDKILVPMALDHGLSPKTLKIAETLLNPGGKIIALHVYEVPKGSVSAYLGEATIREGLNRARAVMEEKTAHLPNITSEIVRGHASRSIIDFTEENGVDCIVVGSHRPDLTDFLLGSTAARVVRHAGCAVHVHREG